MPFLTLRTARLAAALPLLALSFFALGCDDDGDPDPDGPPAGSVGTLYTMENDTDGNRIVVYDRMDDGSLSERTRVAAGGPGSGAGIPLPPDPLQSQDALVLSPDGDHLFAVNAAGNSIAAFNVDAGGGIALVEAQPSNGTFPVGLTVSPDNRFVYVVHSMGSVDGMSPGSIAGFTLDAGGGLTPIAGSVRPLSGAPMTGPAVIAFSPDGNRLVVTEKPSNRIVTYAVDGSGVAGNPVVSASAGVTPFGGAFTSSGLFIASNTVAPGGPLTAVPDAASASSYRMNGDGTMTAVTAEAPSFDTAACWIEITPDDEYAYTTNTASGSISGYRIGSDGTLTPLSNGAPLATLAVAEAAPLDMAIADGYLYTVSGDNVGGDGTISVHRINGDGSLTSVDDDAASGLPAFVTGLAAR